MTVTQRSSSIIYTDYPTKNRLRGHYAAFQVTPTVSVADMWVRLENVTGPQVGLAAGEDGVVH